ncbi:NAD(P)/FAD-dependent oxidoreductase [Castellaniella hirudinis]|uniref:FAD/NAD(P)-dependent oxidoreductase n=1 Tax=Castellaniella hirudinis TaxID=1144617 RepID=UPI0039C242B2
MTPPDAPGRCVPVIIGAGPAGLAAAQTLAAHGLRPVLLDEAPAVGGQIYRQAPPGMRRDARALYGFDARQARAAHQLGERLADLADYRPQTLVWDIQDRTVHFQSPTGLDSLTFSHLILATGATDRTLPFPGWLLPGVFTLGGAQVALKYQGCVIGQTVVLAGTGPLLYLVAWQYAKAGVRVRAVLDSSRFLDQVRAVPGLAASPGLLAKGLWYVGGLRARGIPVHTGARLVTARGDARVQSLVWEARAGDAATRRETPCDAIGFAYGLRSETQLASLLGCAFQFDERSRAWLPVLDDMGRTSRPGVYAAGDGAGIEGAEAAGIRGRQAALALLADAGHAPDPQSIQRCGRRRKRLAGVRRALEQAFPCPQDWAAQADDTLVICRCEEITAGEIRRVARETGAQDINRVKALTRVGMGRCQGRMCGMAAAEIVAQAAGVDLRAVGCLRSQPPVKPLVMGLAPAPQPWESTGEADDD